MTDRPSGDPIGLAGLDPGRSKCGLVLSDASGERLIGAAILPPEPCAQLLQHWQSQGLAQVVLGDGTGHGPWLQRLQRLGLQAVLVDERHSTLAARERYWHLDGRRHWRRWLPAGLRLPARDIDDVVAQLLLERWLGRPLQRDPSLAVWRELPLALGSQGPRSAPAP